MVNLLSVYSTIFFKLFSLACSSALQAACEEMFNDTVIDKRDLKKKTLLVITSLFLPAVLLFGWSVFL